MHSLLSLSLAADPAVAVPDTSLKIWAFVGFGTLVALFLFLDLFVFHKHAHEVSFKEAATWSVIWVVVALLFGVFIYFAYNHHWLHLGLDTPYYVTHDAAAAAPLAQAATAATPPGAAPTDAHGAGLIARGTVTGAMAAEQYIVAYLVEESLSMDNMFVIALIFGSFAIPRKYQHRVLFWGIIGAVVMRGLMIFLGTALINQFQWILIIFGGFLVLTALKMATSKEHDDPSKNLVVRLARRYFHVSPFLDGQRFFTRRTQPPEYVDDGKGHLVQRPADPATLGNRMITPLFLALIMVEFTDLIFAVDSIPAVVAITPDPFIVFTSNIFAILGLRALFFCLSALIARFRFLKPALVLILGFVGVKLLLFSMPPYMDNLFGWLGATEGKPIKIDTTVSLAVVLGTLGAAVLLSALLPAKKDHESEIAEAGSRGDGPG